MGAQNNSTSATLPGLTPEQAVTALLGEGEAEKAGQRMAAFRAKIVEDALTKANAKTFGLMALLPEDIKMFITEGIRIGVDAGLDAGFDLMRHPAKVSELVLGDSGLSREEVLSKYTEIKGRVQD